MMKYVLMFVETEQFAADLAAMDDAERGRAYARVQQWFADHHDKVIHHGRVQQWFADHHDKVIHHGQLMPPDTATTLRLDRGEPLVTDGPFVEGKEVVSGYTEIEAADLDEALRVAKSWPGCPVVEIRPLAS
jgi:hypothetical protein